MTAALLLALPALAAPVVNGQLEPGFPSTVSLGVPWGASVLHVCTGNLITPEIVLSAAHCGDDVNAEAIVAFGRAWVGETARDADDELTFRDAFIHPDFALGTPPFEPFTENDVAVLVLAEPAPMEATPIRLTPVTDAELGTTMLAVGYGATGGDGQGTGVKRSAELILGELEYQHLKAYASDHPDGGMTCQGDSGGPVFVSEGERQVEWGITSFGLEGCTNFSASTRTDLLGDWILDRVEEVHGTRDLCDVNAWYGDGLCDAFCDEVDPDCLPEGGDSGIEGSPKGRCASAEGGGWALLAALGLLGRRRTRSAAG
ncbi:MAG: trypsin-like serine protease [Alphaproteobacteria bacterium]|nr:trypsin-like serine protease [Alphaproteobacteria bacterium]